MLYSIIDVGSNSIRMTIFRHENDTLDMLMNKKKMCIRDRRPGRLLRIHVGGVPPLATCAAALGNNTMAR